MPSDRPDDWDTLREKVIGLGEASLNKSYYPGLQKRLVELERFRALLDQTHDAIFLIKVETGLPVDINASVKAHLGYTKEYLLTTPFVDLIFPEHRTEFIAFTQEIYDLSIQSRQTCITSLISREGFEIPMEVTVRQVAFDGEQYLVVIARDITDRIQVELELRVKENALESSTNGILITDFAGVVMYANQSFAVMFGYTGKRALVGIDVRTFFADLSIGETIIDKLVGCHSFAEETIGLRNNGSTFHIQVSGSIVQSDPEKPLCMMFIVMDITERILTEQMKRETYEQLGRNIEHFAVLGDHIRNPLQVIVGYASMIDDPRARRILEQSQQINELIDRLDHGWIESASVRQFLHKHGNCPELPIKDSKKEPLFRD